MSLARSIQSTPVNIFLKYLLQFKSFNLVLDFPSFLLLSSSPTKKKTLYALLLSPIRATCPAPLVISIHVILFCIFLCHGCSSKSIEVISLVYLLNCRPLRHEFQWKTVTGLSLLLLLLLLLLPLCWVFTIHNWNKLHLYGT